MNGNNGIHGEAIRSSLANKGATGGESMSQGSSKGIRCAGDTLSAPDRIANAPSRHHHGHTQCSLRQFALCSFQKEWGYDCPGSGFQLNLGSLEFCPLGNLRRDTWSGFPSQGWPNWPNGPSLVRL